jgi:hypothetical protein
LTAADALLHPFLTKDFVTVGPNAMPPHVGDDTLESTKMDWDTDDDNDSSVEDEAFRSDA